MPLQLPNVDPKRELARKLVDATISKIPMVGDYYSIVVNMISPPEAEEKLEKWRNEVTDTLNNIEKVIDELLPTITLSQDASCLAYWISKTSENGCLDPVMFDEIQRAFPEATQSELENACGELGLVGVATLSAAIGYKVRIIRPTVSLFEIFDPLVFEEANPRSDAARLARYILAKDETAGAEEMVENFGWEVRRFNPAIAIICSMIEEGRKSAEIHPTYYCCYVMPNPKERAKLRHFADSTAVVTKSVYRFRPLKVKESWFPG